MVLAALNVENDLQPLQPEPLPARTWRQARSEDLSWAREYLVPWVLRRIRHQSSGDHVTPNDVHPCPDCQVSAPRRASNARSAIPQSPPALKGRNPTIPKRHRPLGADLGRGRPSLALKRQANQIPPLQGEGSG